MTLVAAQPITRPKLDKEYVVGGAMSWYANAKKRVLSHAFDDLSGDLGIDVYERMMMHPQVSAKINILRTWVLQSGVTFVPAVTDKHADGYQQASELVTWAERVFDDLDTATDDVLLDMTLALAYGSRVAELISEYDTTYTGRTQLVIRRINVKPVRSTRFVVDDFMNVLGIYGGRVLDGNDPRPHVLPREKFAIWSFRPKDNDPRGSSLLRPAYNAWNMHLQTLPEYYKYLVQFASPSLVGKTAEGAEREMLYDDNGDPLREVTAQEFLLSQLLAFQNGTALALPAGAELDALWSSGEGKAFLNAFELFNNEIAVAITSQLLATEQGKYGSRSQAGVHQDTISITVQQMKRSICRMLRRDVLYDTIRVNYGDDIAALAPLISLGETEQRDWATELQAAGRVGYKVAPSHLPDLDSRFGLPAREIEEAILLAEPQSEQPEDGDESIEDDAEQPSSKTENDEDEEGEDTDAE